MVRRNLEARPTEESYSNWMTRATKLFSTLLQVRRDGGIPIGRVIRDSAGNLYGITSLGGDPTCSCGTVYKLTKSGTLKVLHSFKGGKDGAQNEGQPELGLVMVNGDLYGSASFGGVSGCDGSLGCGVLFKVTQSGKETVLHRFTGQADGAFPQDLISDQAGNIYGATGGSYMQGNGGTLFKLDTCRQAYDVCTRSPKARMAPRRDGACCEMRKACFMA